MPDSLTDIQTRIAKLGLSADVVARFRSHDPAKLSPEELLVAEQALLQRLQALPEETLARFRLAAEKRAHAEAARATREAAAAIGPSVEEMLREEEERAAVLERREGDERAWSEALKRYGKGRVGYTDTPRGRIILRVLTLAEQDQLSASLSQAEGYQLRVNIGREGALSTVVPTASHPDINAVRATLEMFPGRWADMYNLRDALARGEAELLEGKA